VIKTVNDRFRFPVADGILKPQYVNHIYADVDNTFKEFRTQSLKRRTPVEAESPTDLAHDPSPLLEGPDATLKTDGPEERLYPSTDNREALEIPDQQDYWTMPNFDVLIRNHVIPRTNLYVPTPEECPIPLEWLDITRRTDTDLAHPNHRSVEDFWTEDRRSGSGKAIDPDEMWIGKPFLIS
jgi:hypothetical protein